MISPGDAWDTACSPPAARHVDLYDGRDGACWKRLEDIAAPIEWGRRDCNGSGTSKLWRVSRWVGGKHYGFCMGINALWVYILWWAEQLLLCVCVWVCANSEGGSSHAHKWSQGNCFLPCLASSLMSYCLGWEGGRLCVWVGAWGWTTGIREIAQCHLETTVCSGDLTVVSVASCALFSVQCELFPCVLTSKCLLWKVIAV